jgi:hypothetical protein
MVVSRIYLPVAGRAVCELRKCGSVCLCVCGSMQYWPFCGIFSCLCVEELWDCVLMCLYEYAVLAIGLSLRNELSVC